MSPHDEPPSFRVHISAGTVRHIQPHIDDPRERSLWVEFLGSPPDIPPTLESASLGSLGRPLYVEYDQHDKRGVFLYTTRELVTRSGLSIVVRLIDEHSGNVVTAFFPYATIAARPRRRWLATLRSRVELYASCVTYGLAQAVFIPPSPEVAFPSTEPPGTRRNVRFVNDERWGIRTVEIEGVNERVFGTPPPWPEC